MAGELKLNETKWNMDGANPGVAKSRCAGATAREQSPSTTFQAIKNARNDELDAKLCLARKTARGRSNCQSGRGIVRVVSERYRRERI